MSSPLLEIVIPTYNRPAHALRAINSCLSIRCDDLVVSCNSNGPEPALESLRPRSRLRYSSFNKNLGPQANFAFLAKQALGKFFMLLSDEDYLDPIHASAYLAFLRSLHPSVAVVSSSIYDSQNGSFYSRPGCLHGRSMGINQYLCCSEPIPAYMSGLVFKTEQVTDALIDECLARADGANSYAHLDLVLEILGGGNLASWCDNPFVVKGDEAKIGGDSYSHKASVGNSWQRSAIQNVIKDNNLDLNPHVYGPDARVQQFVYRSYRLARLRNATPVAKTIGSLHLLQFFSEAVLRAPAVVRLPSNTCLLSTVERAISGADSASTGVWVRAFLAVIRLQPLLRWIAIKSLNCFLRVMRKLITAFGLR